MSKGERLRLLREKAGYSQDDLAKKLHTTKQTIYKYEKDIITNIPSKRIEELAIILDSTPEYIMGWEKIAKKNDIISNAVVKMRNDQDVLDIVEIICSLDREKLLAVKTLLSPFLEKPND